MNNQQGYSSRRRRLPPEGHPLRYAFIDRAGCPGCGSVELKTYKTASPAGGDAVARYSRCLGPACRVRFVRFDGDFLVPTNSRLPYVHECRARCPSCHGLDLRTYATRRQGDGSITRHTRCRACEHHFLVVAD